MSVDRVIEGATCLGCGCSCDDIDISVRGGRIVEARRACDLGAAWFGDGSAPARALVSGREASVDEAVAAAAGLLQTASQPLVYLAPDVTCEAQREAAGLADLLRASIDSVSSDTVLPAVLAAQEQGTASATLGEVRNRADLLVFWGVDPSARYPRYWSRYAPEPAGVHVPGGRASRTVVAVDIGRSRGPAEADQRYAFSPQDELTALGWLRGLIASEADAGSARAGAVPDGSVEARAGALVEVLCAARYLVLVADG
jgi:formylmethanofuran dehydrogenase subunit B